MIDTRPTTTPAAVLLMTLLTSVSMAEDADEELDPAKLEAQQVRIGRIVLDKQDVFDLSNPKENNAFYRLANKLHIVTKDSVIEKQLLFKPGDLYSKRLVAETGRILRSNKYFYDVTITPKNLDGDTVDLHVATRDVWTLKPGLSYSRKGGESRTSINFEETNFLGRGQEVSFASTSDVDRDTTLFEFRDRHFGSNWTELEFRFADNSDGKSNLVSAVRPFFALDTRWAAGGSTLDEDRVDTLYLLGEKTAEYRAERVFYSAFGGWSAGLRDGWVRRYTAGAVYDENTFSEALEPSLPALIPADRKLVYPFVGIEILQDRFETTSNHDQIKRTEDFRTGTRLSASLGYADEDFGADRDAVLYAVSASTSFGKLTDKFLLLSARASGRIESGNWTNGLVSFRSRYYWQQSKKRTFFATLSGTWGDGLDLDNPVQLGGQTGLRGYPLRYQSGDSKLLLTLEQRYFTEWYPFRLFRIGGAIFTDIGRVWGDNPLGEEKREWLTDVGIGLRLAGTRTGSRSMVHIDIAFPLNGDASIDDLQILVESKKGF